ncbi:dihydroxy-acid dehydratase [Planosporangium thailandense]|uniref:Dihydroxy-acid dehydratase n=1 Tax=Planosporangium thailandense TaxID=765197 RepID=A0ABX0Y6L9_9ACTN|nr:IlvD/Edd family dehydratase [Planosporangium thailandense]NJC72954.1 dihydroxy-acid dehydratase [Planosporangium thailandense]
MSQVEPVPHNGRNHRSAKWFQGDSINAASSRAWLRSQGHSASMFDGRPTIGVINSWADTTPCNMSLRDVAEHVKRGVRRAGGFPLELPVMSLGETLMKPTTMLYRNLMAMEVEECIRAYPFDGVVLLSGCDKTTPGMILGLASTDVPGIVVTSGPMLRSIRGTQELGGSSGLWKADTAHRTGAITGRAWREIEGCIARSAGHCGVMGSASTMAIVAEALGLTLPGNAAIPAVDSRRLALAEESGYRIVQMVDEGLVPERILTRAAFENAITALMAVGGSTNAIIHITAIARRAGVDITPADFDRISRRTPVIANVLPVGTHQMEDFFYAGGLPAVIHELGDLIDPDCVTVTGRSLPDECADAEILDPDTIRPLADPLQADGGIAVLRGNLCPDGAVIKHAAASPGLRRHRGRAVVFRDKYDLEARVHDPALDVDASSVLVLQNSGPVGGPGMPEWGMLPIPLKLAKQGVVDMVRISDARMSGTSFGTCVLHVSPEAAVGGPLGLVEDGDEIELDIANRSLTLLVSDEELARRRERWRPAVAAPQRGFTSLYVRHVEQAHEGADFGFLAGRTSVSEQMYQPMPD